MELLNKIHLADNSEVLKAIPDKSIDMILEDMPYNNTSLHFDYAVDLQKFWAERLRVIKDNGAIVLTSQQPFTTDLINSNRKLFRFELIWEKTMKMGFYNANKMPLRGHENILVFYKKAPVYNPQKYSTGKITNRTSIQKENRYKGYGDAKPSVYQRTEWRHPHSVIKVSNWNGALFGDNSKAVVHPTQKPIELFSWLIKSFTNPGATVFDGFAGSGTTALACIQENRNYVCCEWDEKYFQLAVNRINKTEAITEFSE